MSINAPALITTDEYNTHLHLAKMFHSSGLFSDTKSEAQALVKILAGRELGIGPFESMRDINIIQGKTCLAAGLVGARIKKTGVYDYTPIKFDDTTCVLRWFKNGKALTPDVEFNIGHAQALGLASKDNYKKQARTMLFWRALTMGARMFCPEVFGGPIYTPDEIKGGYMDMAVDEVRPETLNGGTYPVVDAEIDQSPEMKPEDENQEQLPKPLPNPWKHVVQGIKEITIQGKGAYLFKASNAWLSKYASSAMRNRISADDAANILAAIANPQLKEVAENEVMAELAELDAQDAKESQDEDYNGREDQEAA